MTTANPPGSTGLWGGRFAAHGDPLFRRFNDSLAFDRRLVREDIEGSAAWARAIAHAGVITPGELGALLTALEDVLEHATRHPESIEQADDEDVHSWVERELVARVGDLGKKLHTGRSRNDQVATDLRLWTLKQLAERRREADAVIASLLALADRERDTVFPGYTHLQRAQPVLFAHWCLAYVEMLTRDIERMGDTARRAGFCPLGSGALAGTAYPIDRMRLARDLGFTAPTGNSLDAVSDRDFVAESLSAAALCAMHLSRLAEDIIFYATGEAGLVELSDAVTSGSSLMPQKKNPDALELIRGKSGRIVGSLMTLLTVLKGLPLAYNKDLQEDKEPLFDAMDHLSLSLRVLTVVLDGMTVRRDRAREAALGGYSNATELADYLVAKGVPFRDAHHDVGRLVREAIGDSTPLEGLSIERMAKVNPRIGADVFVALTVDSALAKRDVPGGTAPAQVSDSIERGRLKLARRQRASGTHLTIRDARVEDLEEICAIVSHWTGTGEHLPRSREDILECISEFAVAVHGGRVVGCGSLWIYTPQLAEIRSLGVAPGATVRGIGRSLTRHLIDRAAELGIPRVFVLTRVAEFFAKCGFRTVSVNSLPEKVLKDCAACPRREACDEVAMSIETSSAAPERT